MTTTSGTSSRLSRARDWALVLAAPLILIGVVINHHVLTATKNLDPWKGGGFGMFATIDSFSNRTMYVYGVQRDGAPFYLDPLTRGMVDMSVFPGFGHKALSMPHDENLTKIAKRAFRLDDIGNDPSTDQDDIVSIRVEVRSLAFDSTSSTLRTTVVNAIEVPVP